MNYCNLKQLTNLIANLTSLEEAIIHVEGRIHRRVQEIGRLLRSHQSLMKLHILTTSYGADGPEMQNLCNSLANEWDFESVTVYNHFQFNYDVLYASVFSRKI